MFEEIKNIKTSNTDIRNFGITIGLILFIISGLLFYYGKELYQVFGIIALVLMLVGVVLPILLKPLFLVWMIFAVILGWIMTRVILSLVFYFIITPIAIITRLLGEDFLTLKDLGSRSYWNFRDGEKEKNQNYEKQF